MFNKNIRAALTYFYRQISRFRIPIVYCVLILSIATYIYNTFMSLRSSSRPNNLLNYAKSYVLATDWLKSNTSKNSIILTEWTEGHQVVLLADRKVVATSKVYPSEAKRISERYIDLAIFFYSSDEAKIRGVLEKHGVDYVFIRKLFDFSSSCKRAMKCNRNNPFLQALIKGRVNSFPFIKKVYENNYLVIYKYQR